jgi:hypothetical protein
MIGIVFEVGGFRDRCHCGWIVGVEVGTFIFACFSIEDCDIRVLVWCTSFPEEILEEMISSTISAGKQTICATYLSPGVQQGIVLW